MYGNAKDWEQDRATSIPAAAKLPQVAFYPAAPLMKRPVI
jgi:hypothetical protein